MLASGQGAPSAIPDRWSAFPDTPGVPDTPDRQGSGPRPLRSLPSLSPVTAEASTTREAARGRHGNTAPRVLIVTNDFPPRSGGIQSFVHALASRLPAETVTVYAPSWDGAAAFDSRQPFRVVRHPGSLMLPVPRVARRAARILTEYGCDTVLFGAAAPLGLLAPALRRAGAQRIVALTHGHEAGWAALPGARTLLHRIGDQVDVVTYLGEYFRVRLASALSAEAAARMVRLAPGVDTAAFRPGAGGAEIRERLGLGDRPIVVCVSRMVPRKGQDTLIRAWPQVLAAAERKVPAPVALVSALRPGRHARASSASVPAQRQGGRPRRAAGHAGPSLPAQRQGSGPGGPGAAAGEARPSLPGHPVLLLVGDGPYRAELGRLAQRVGVSDSVVFTGPVPWEELPAYYDAGNVFAMPCRTRRKGLDVEGLGIVYLEASAAGLPVIGGDSGGAPDAILDDETGHVIPGRDVAAVADRLIELLSDPAAAAAMGSRGLAWVDREWRWDFVADRLRHILAG
jgi:phosphatidylinositol alpha-1,6-mannosyltransferase